MITVITPTGIYIFYRQIVCANDFGKKADILHCASFEEIELNSKITLAPVF